MNLKRSLESLFNGIGVTVLSTPSTSDPAEVVPVSKTDPLPVMVTNQAASGGASNVPTAILPPQTLTVSTTPVGLTVPTGANAATVFIVSGSVRRSVGGTPGTGTAGLDAGDSEDISGAELGAYQMVRDGGSDAQVYVEYRVMG